MSAVPPRRDTPLESVNTALCGISLLRRYTPCCGLLGPISAEVARYINLRTPFRSMPCCRNCDSFVTEDYVRVFAPNGMEEVRVCPNCEDKLRDGAEVREARSSRGN